MSNYGNDRLGLYTFESVIKYVQCWTNLQMVTLPPLLLAEKYFKMHPDELDPIWGVSRVLKNTLLGGYMVITCCLFTEPMRRPPTP